MGSFSSFPFARAFSAHSALCFGKAPAAAQNSAFGIPEVKRGLVAAGGGLLRLPQRIPYQIAMELALTGDHLPAQRAHELGLVNVLAEPGHALEAAIELASRITANGRWRSLRPSG